MKAIYGLYDNPQSAQRAFAGLRAAGVREQEIAVMSSKPFDDWEFGSRDKESSLTWLAGGGAAVGLVSAYLLTWVTQESWPINTGGMPIVTNWTNIIILFEMTMLGAVLVTVAGFLIMARLPGKVPEIYDPAVSGGSILVGVANPDESRVAALERALVAAGAERVKRR